MIGPCHGPGPGSSPGERIFLALTGVPWGQGGRVWRPCAPGQHLPPVGGGATQRGARCSAVSATMGCLLPISTWGRAAAPPITSLAAARVRGARAARAWAAAGPRHLDAQIGPHGRPRPPRHLDAQIGPHGRMSPPGQGRAGQGSKADEAHQRRTGAVGTRLRSPAPAPHKREVRSTPPAAPWAACRGGACGTQRPRPCAAPHCRHCWPPARRRPGQPRRS
jgi:hypothetical protein